MQSDLYDDRPQDSPKPDAAADEKREHQDDQQTGMLPKTFFGGKDLTPGTRCEVEIEQVMDDEVHVRYVPHSESDDKGAGKDAPPPPPDAGTEGASSMYG